MLARNINAEELRQAICVVDAKSLYDVIWKGSLGGGGSRTSVEHFRGVDLPKGEDG